MIAGSGVKVGAPDVEDCLNLSDHKVLKFDLYVKKPEKALASLKIPNWKLAESFIRNSLKNASNTFEFIQNISHRMKQRNFDISMTLKRKPRKRELLDCIMQLADEDSDLCDVINRFWKEKTQENEYSRFSEYSREAFRFLKQVYKYHEFNRRDGSIINRIIDEQGNLITEEDKVHELVLQALKEIQFCPDEPVHDQPIPFPDLPLPSEDEMDFMLSHLSSDKAIAFDGVTDALFSKGVETRSQN